MTKTTKSAEIKTYSLTSAKARKTVLDKTGVEHVIDPVVGEPGRYTVTPKQVETPVEFQFAPLEEHQPIATVVEANNESAEALIQWAGDFTLTAPEDTSATESTPVKTRKNAMMTIEQVEALNLPLLDGIKKYATEHYTQGWDVIVEAYSDEDILAKIGRTKSLKGALLKLYPVVKITKEQQAEHDAEAAAGA